MPFENRVVWSEGMFLRAQHFQQADRWTERLVCSTLKMLSPYPWGIAEMNIDRGALANGQFTLTSLRGILPDGTTFDAPTDCDLPPPLQLEEPLHDAVIYLALPVRQPGKAEVTISKGYTKKVRMVAFSYEAPDTNTDTDFSAPINVGRLNFSFLKQGDELTGYVVIGLAKAIEVRSDKAVILDHDYIVPSLNCATNVRLKELATELLGIVRHRAEAIAARIGGATNRSTAQIGDYVLLLCLNKTEPILAHIVANATRIHPFTFFEQCIQLAGALATFTATAKRPPQFPPYRHEDLKSTFTAIFNELRASLSVVLEHSAVAIELELRAHGIRVGTIYDRSLLDEAGFVLAVRADISGEDIRRKLPGQIKIGPVERIAELVNVALPGIPICPLPVAPRHLPYMAGTVYFELDTKTPLWEDFCVSGAIALHLSGDFPGIEIELWALRE